LPRIVLTPKVVYALRSEERTVYWDDHPQSPPRFGVRVNGTRAAYVVVVGKAWLSLGSTRAVTLDAARDLARAAIGRAAQGLDPRPTKARGRGGEITVAQMVSAFIAAGTVAPLTALKYTRVVNRLGKFGQRQANSVLRSELAGHLATYKPGMRDYVLKILKTAYRWARDEEVRPDVTMVTRDPTRKIEALTRGKVRLRPLTAEEIKKLWHGVEILTPPKRGYLRLLLLLALRRGEAHAATWRDIDLDGGTWTVRTTERKIKKAKKASTPDLVVPLHPFAIRELRTLTGLPRPFPFSVDNIPKEMKLSSGIPDVYPHALRDTVSTWMESEGCPPHVLSLVLGHVSVPGSTASDVHYTRRQRPAEVKAWLFRWADYVEGLVR
jgi:integrase